MKAQLRTSMIIPMLSVTLSFPVMAHAGVTKTTLDGVRVNPVQFDFVRAVEMLTVATPGNANTKLIKKSYQLSRDEDVRALMEDVKNLIALRGLQEQAEKVAKTAKQKKPEFENKMSKSILVGLDEIQRLGDLVLSRRASVVNTDADVKMALVHIRELVAAVSANFVSPVPAMISGLSLAKTQNAQVGDRAQEPASNIDTSKGSDLSKINPPDSSFWRDPGDISKKETYFGFGRKEIPALPTVATIKSGGEGCDYEAPKTGYGSHAGIEVICGGKTWKIKFGNETHNEQFTTRIVNALGYNANIVEFVDGLVLKYDRDVIKEYNSRKAMYIGFSVVGLIPLVKKNFQDYQDPFADMVAGAVLTNGRRLNSQELRQHLLKDLTPGAEQKNEAYKMPKSKEDGVAYLILQKASAEPKIESNEFNVGAWSWDEEDHTARRELRGFAIFAAWINNYDMRWDNTRLRIVEKADGARELRHVISDLGSGFGAAGGQLKHSSGELNDLPWTLASQTAWAIVPRPYYITNFISLFPNETFRRTTIDDARWMARMIGQLSEEQILAALMNTGLESAEIKAALEKLVSRRDNLVQVLGLENEVGLLRPNGVNTMFNYDPKTEGPMQVKGHAPAPVGTKIVVGGVIQ